MKCSISTSIYTDLKTTA